WHQWDAAGGDAERLGAQLAFGTDANGYYDFSKADVIVSLDADFLSCGPAHLRYVHDFTARRRAWDGDQAPNRLYVVESQPTPTGGVADHRLPLRAAQVEAFARTLAARLGVPVGQGEGALPAEIDRGPTALGRGLQAPKGASIILAGSQQPPAVHALAHTLNQTLGNAGQTVLYTEPIEVRPVHQLASLQELVRDMAAGRVEVLLVLGGNPV